MLHKKLINFGMTFVLCFSLLACKKTEQVVSLGDDFKLGYDSQTFFSDTRNIAKTEDGYYFNYDSTFLFFMDATTGKVTMVCNKPECEHDLNGNCNADVTNSMGQVWYYDNALFLIGMDESNQNEYWLYKQDLDGTNREKVTYLFTVGSGEGLGFVAEVHRGYLYYTVANDNLNDSSKRVMYRVKLKKNAKSEEFSTVSGYDSGFMRFYGYGDYIYFEKILYEDEDGNNEKDTLVRYNTITKKFEELCSGIVYDYAVVDDMVYFYDSKVIQVLNMKDKSVAEFYDPKVKACVNFKYDGKYFYFDNYLDIFLANMDESKRTIQIVNKEGKLVKNLSVPNKGNCEYGDEQYLFVSRGFGGDEVDDDQILNIYDKSQIESDQDSWTTIKEKIFAKAEG